MVPAKTILEPSVHLKSAVTCLACSSPSEIGPRSTRRVWVVAAESDAICCTMTGGMSSVNWTAKEDMGRADRSTLEEAVTEIWNATSSPTFTSDVQKTTIESTKWSKTFNPGSSWEIGNTYKRVPIPIGQLLVSC